MKLVADENIVGLDCLPGDVDVITAPGRAIDRELLRDADALWVRSVTPVTAKLVGDSPLRFVGTATAGVEHVDREALAERGIRFAAAPGANAMAVVEYVLAAMLHQREPWEILEAGGALGIVGHGHVGRRLATFGEAMGWRVRVCDPWVAREPSSRDFVGLPQILGCDVISLHCSLHEDAPWPSRHLIDDAALAALRGDAWLINASRGAVVDNAALRAHLGRSPALNVILDVWEGEPDIAWDLLSRAELRLATPHIAGYSWDAKWSATRMLADVMREADLLRGDLRRPEVPVPFLPDTHSAALDATTQDIAALMAACYAIRRDDAALRGVLVRPGSERPRAFDELRRDYPLRRELSALMSQEQRDGSASRFLVALSAARSAGC